MIVGIGIDSVEIARMNSWISHPDQQLARVFCASEIAYARSCPAKQAERLAARFAAKEAFFKALCQMIPGHNIPFLTLCRNTCTRARSNAAPTLEIDWIALAQAATLPHATPISHLSITHTRSIATALVLLEDCR